MQLDQQLSTTPYNPPQRETTQRLNATWAAFLAAAAPELRAVAESLPWRLGLTQFPEQSWETFWTFDPNRRPAHYALSERMSDQDHDLRVRNFDRAHHHAVFFGLLFDRLADRQVARSAGFSALRSTLLRAWVDTLTEACEDRALARRSIARALSLLRAGTRLEASSLRARRLSPATYAEQTRLKLRWCSATPRVLVEQGQGEERAAAFERCYDLFGMSVQCIDDAVDAEEDEAIHGVSVPRLLGLADEALVEAAVVLVERAAEHATRFGFSALCEWLARFDRFLRDARLQGDRLRFGREGRALGEVLALEL
ncbi:MAG TPA: hypothetical protein VMG12_43220 [Polyangiaceae bacterium]|nr:hypothetical protein [Polyangiaceae bacterium]